MQPPGMDSLNAERLVFIRLLVCWWHPPSLSLSPGLLVVVPYCLLVLYERINPHDSSWLMTHLPPTEDQKKGSRRSAERRSLSWEFLHSDFDWSCPNNLLFLLRCRRTTERTELPSRDTSLWIKHPAEAQEFVPGTVPGNRYVLYPLMKTTLLTVVTPSMWHLNMYSRSVASKKQEWDQRKCLQFLDFIYIVKKVEVSIT
jgi:hypothetical protein